MINITYNPCIAGILAIYVLPVHGIIGNSTSDYLVKPTISPSTLKYCHLGGQVMEGYDRSNLGKLFYDTANTSPVNSEI
ncbi:MAG: hypothetical protein QNJ34_23925 [Xenococcaceae cyanobacterium MO_188.B29]|nr:hypothetical protein [Xenococcaceae cyanobacterium MO_188.B29]